MTLKKVILNLVLPIFLFSLFLTSCNNDEISRVDGVIENIDSLVTVKLYRLDFDKLVFLDSLIVKSKKPSFSFKLGKLEEPTFLHLSIEGKRKNVAVLLLESGEKVTLDVNLNDFMGYKVEGSEGSIKTQMLSIQLAKTKKSLDSLSTKINLAESTDDKERLLNEYNETLEKQRTFSTNFIWANPMSRANVMALYQQYDNNQYVFDRPEDTKLFKVVATQIIAMYPESGYAIGMQQDIKNQEKLLSGHNIKSLIENAESTLPEIALPNPNGEIIRLSSLKGKVILLDFWASSSQECLLENRELLEVYKQFNSKGFEVYQVSFDSEREPWMAAIESARLPWINVSELDPDGSIVAGYYNVTQIPANYLINRDFSIVGKNLYGKDLVAKLKEIL